MSSFGGGFLEPLDIEKEIPNHPISVGKILMGENFESFKEITKLGRIRYKVELNRKEDYANLSKLNFATYNMKLFQPVSTRETVCFIRGVPPEYTEEKIKNNICAEVAVLRVERIKRMRETHLIPTWNLKVTVEGPKAPPAVKIYNCAFRAETYIFPIKQCILCWRFGHTAKHCKAKRRCKKCSKSHEQQGECQALHKCVNCDEEHAADDRNCTERRRRLNVLREMQKTGKTYLEAETKFPKTSNRFEVLEADEEYPGLEDSLKSGN